MDLKRIIRKLGVAGYEVIDQKFLPNGSGEQLIILGGFVLNIFNNGNWNVQGKASPERRRQLEKFMLEKMGWTRPS